MFVLRMIHIDTYVIHIIYLYIYIFTYTYIHICIMTQEPTGWRRLIGSSKLQIIFHKRATRYRALLVKMTSKDKGSYESLPPCTHRHKKTSPSQTQATR